MNIGIIGCGFVGDYYLSTLPLHPELKVVAITDRDPQRAARFAAVFSLATVGSVAELLARPDIELVLNLTNPREHYAISRAALEAGKHVYSEKPFAMNLADARALVALAEARGLAVASAPCSHLGETAQTLGKALRENAVGAVRLVYAELDDGMVHRMPFRKWTSKSGVPWPYKDEFEVGCTLEHAGYYLCWLASWFGPAVTVTSFASTRIPEKTPGETLNLDSPDFSVACVQFANGVVARLTCSIVAPHDHALRVFGEDGVIGTRKAWDYRAPVFSRRFISIRRKTMLHPLARRHALPPPPHGKVWGKGSTYMDFARGPAEMVAALREGRRSRVAPDFSLHVNELALAIHTAREQGATYRMTTTFTALEPMPWSK